MRLTVPAKVIAEIGQNDNTHKFAVVVNQTVCNMITNTEEGYEGASEALLNGHEIGVNVWVDNTSTFTYQYKRKEK